MSARHAFGRRQQWESPMEGGMASAIGAYAVHSRFLGVNPTVPHDLIATIIVPLCVILYIVGYATLPNPEDGVQAGRRGATREVASFTVFIVLCTMQAVSLKHACFQQPPWIPYTILFGIALLLWLPAIYAFCLLAVALDSSSFVRSKTFFYVGFGFAHALAIGILIAMHRQKRMWEYELGQEKEHPEPEVEEVA
ncbi:hypothetical protein PtA15_6A666 [Puccinia triticina]|uniref:Chitin synthase export chaperone n=1 Tax=Puccinia triticina TaxID=208348 RepID=A0ABY7CPH4_9BASI|nr:uncharacterized protein PtA15_6A666 [Puccinia triticina]WAQ86036.1 hypothetical protein PtA15_6A666 [Puccinia triticina]WAR55931.1 hypothetical protein PtB15_6B675 [Puccinia triticina]